MSELWAFTASSSKSHSNSGSAGPLGQVADRQFVAAFSARIYGPGGAASPFPPNRDANRRGG